MCQPWRTRPNHTLEHTLIFCKGHAILANNLETREPWTVLLMNTIPHHILFMLPMLQLPISLHFTYIQWLKQVWTIPRISLTFPGSAAVSLGQLAGYWADDCAEEEGNLVEEVCSQWNQGLKRFGQFNLQCQVSKIWLGHLWHYVTRKAEKRCHLTVA